MKNDDSVNRKILTIAIPAFKNIETLERAINSILKQDVKLLQKINIYVSVDASNNILQVEQMLKKYAQVLDYNINVPGLGMADNWNNCVYNSQTEYVAILHDDDYLLPNYLTIVKEIIEKRQFDCILFDHYFEIDGNIERKRNKHIAKLKNGKMQRLSHLEYWLGGYNYKTVPTCGILFKRESFLKSGGYLKEEGYSADESFMENFIRSGYKVFFYAKKTSVYTYTTNTNLSSQKNIQKKFLLENIKYREKVSRNIKKYNIYNRIFGKSITLYYAGPWIKDLMPEMIVTRVDKIKLKIYKCMVILWHGITCLNYRKI